MIPLEDSVADMIGKTQRGLGLTDEALAQRAGVSTAALGNLKDGQADREALPKIAAALGLDGARLAAIAAKEYYPKVSLPAHGFAAFNTPFEDMTVNSYLFWDAASKEGVAFDTGSSCEGMVQRAKAEGVAIRLILLTHTHGDHIFDLDSLKKQTGAPAFVCELESIPEAESFKPGRTFTLGGLKIGTRLTSGHSAGGITYVVDGLKEKFAVVGDAIFAGSMGGGGVSFRDAVRNNREQIYTLPGETILCPGHGPLTTVGQEKEHNPFAALSL